MLNAGDLPPDYFNEPDKMPRPHVEFQTRSVERRVGQGETFRIVYEDVVFAIIRPPGSRDSVEKVASDWIKELEAHAESGRCPQHWPRAYNEALQGFIRGEAIPLDGTPIKSWAVLTPSERKILLKADILTVETLAAGTSDILDRIGMGGHRLVGLAKDYVADKNGPGKMALQLDALKVENARMMQELEELRSAVQMLKAQVPGATRSTLPAEALLAPKEPASNSF